MSDGTHNGIIHSKEFSGPIHVKSEQTLGSHLEGRCLKDLMGIFHIKDINDFLKSLYDLSGKEVQKIDNEPIRNFLTQTNIISPNGGFYHVNRERLESMIIEAESISES